MHYWAGVDIIEWKFTLMVLYFRNLSQKPYTCLLCVNDLSCIGMYLYFLLLADQVLLYKNGVWLTSESLQEPHASQVRIAGEFTKVHTLHLHG